MTWSDAREFYLDPLLERMSQADDEEKQGQVPTDPQGQYENMLALHAMLGKGKISPADAQKAFRDSYGKDLRHEMGDRLVAMMKAQQKKTSKSPFTKSKTTFVAKPKPTPTTPTQGGTS